MRLRSALVLLILTSGFAQSPSSDELVVTRNVMVPMRDGVRRATDIYRPAHNGIPAAGKFPVILERTPYNKDDSGYLTEFVRSGYIAIAQDTRGRYHSKGHWRLMRDDVNDGYDTAKWIGTQPWCSCKIGTVGGSYQGGTQHALAISHPPFLTAMVPIDAATNAGYFGIRHNGGFELRFFNWTSIPRTAVFSGNFEE